MSPPTPQSVAVVTQPLKWNAAVPTAGLAMVGATKPTPWTPASWPMVSVQTAYAGVDFSWVHWVELHSAGVAPSCTASVALGEYSIFDSSTFSSENVSSCAP